MKLFRYDCGDDSAYGVAADADDAYRRRAQVDATFAFVRVVISEVRVPGYEIKVTSTVEREPDEFDAMERADLVTWLKENYVHYVPQWGDTRLREAARAAKEENA